MIRSVLSLRAGAGMSSAVEDFYARNGVLERARRFPGCLDAQLMRAVRGGAATHLVIADWGTAQDYQRWVDDPWRAALAGELHALLDTDPEEPLVGGVFEPVPPAGPWSGPREATA